MVWGAAMVSPSYRAVCPRCRRPERVCYCAHLVTLPTRTRVVILQHPRERDVPIGTAHMARLCLPEAELHVGVDWSESAALRRALSDPERPAVLLYPEDGAEGVGGAVAAPMPSGPITLIVVDGTWWQARKVVRTNPMLAALPRYPLAPARPSEYRIRMEPAETCVSTIEALAQALGELEGDPDGFQRLLEPFRAMVDQQVAWSQSGLGRERGPKGPRPPRPRVPPELVRRAGDLVCVVGEVNAWPYSSAERAVARPDELVHWVACRPATGERFELVVAPRGPLCPSTPTHIGIGPDELARGETLEVFRERWAAFIRPTDILCAWGGFALEQLAAVGGAVPDAPPVSIRQLIRQASGGEIGTADEHVARLGLTAGEPLGRGRAGTRLATLVAAIRNLLYETPPR